ncbi:UNVERIFIED_CONTAM: hypothetical protein FKN15_044223 [Acipenser sinensis]
MSAQNSLNMKQPPIQSTAGAVPIRNEKGEISMEKVKVKRYVSGKRPDYAPMESSDEEEEDFQFIKKGKDAEPEELEEEVVSDPRLKRLQNRVSEDVEERLARHRQIAEPEVVMESSSESEEEGWLPDREESSEEEEEEVDDEEIERRRAMMRQRAQERKNEDMEIMEVEEEGKSGEESESESEYEEYTDSEDEAEPRLKPVFIRKKDRATVAEREAEELRQKELEAEAKKQVEERRHYTLKIVEEEAKKEFEENRRTIAALEALDTDGENEEEEYEAWKVRELKRIKRDREAREAMEREKAEIERFHNLTRKDRATVAEREAEELRQKELEAEAKKQVEERRHYTLKIVEEEAKKEFEENRRTIAALEALDTDGENEEEEYEAWKVRELKRIKRDREAREAMEREKAEIERFHNLTEEERRAELRSNGKLITNKASKGKYKFLQKYYHRGAFFMNEEQDVFKRDFSAPTLEDHFNKTILPKVMQLRSNGKLITNKASKGKYKFLQKYYHRGAFFMNEEQDVFKRDFSAPTLEDHFNKTILPKVMQVKNFGRSGRTKYTHLVDQDTTSFDSAWAQETAQNSKFFKQKAGGVRDVFDRPAVKRKT